jgi:hypothetical protein
MVKIGIRGRVGHQEKGGHKQEKQDMATVKRRQQGKEGFREMGRHKDRIWHQGARVDEQQGRCTVELIKDRVEHQEQDRASRRRKASRSGYRAQGRGRDGVNRIGHQGEGGMA